MRYTSPARRTTLIMAVLAGFVLAGAARADSTGFSAPSEPPIEKALEAVDDGKYKKATRYLKRHLKKNPNDADALNLMGYSLRKLERFDESERYYLQALEIQPEHLGANEYLGELYLQTGRPALARERLAVLEKACPGNCEQLKDLNDAVVKYSESNGP